MTIVKEFNLIQFDASSLQIFEPLVSVIFLCWNTPSLFSLNIGTKFACYFYIFCTTRIFIPRFIALPFAAFSSTTKTWYSFPAFLYDMATLLRLRHFLVHVASGTVFFLKFAFFHWPIYLELQIDAHAYIWRDLTVYGFITHIISISANYIYQYFTSCNMENSYKCKIYWTFHWCKIPYEVL